MVTAGVMTWRPPRLDGLYWRAGQLEYNRGMEMCVCETDIHQFLFVYVCGVVSVGVLV